MLTGVLAMVHRLSRSLVASMRIGFVGLLLTALAAAPAAARSEGLSSVSGDQVAPPAAPKATLSALAIDTLNGAVRITLQVDRAVEPYRLLEVNSPPPRLVLDLPNVVPGVPPTTAVGQNDVVRVRVALYKVDPHVTRVVFDLARALPHRMDTSGIAEGRIVVLIGREDSVVQRPPVPLPPAEWKPSVAPVVEPAAAPAVEQPAPAQAPPAPKVEVPPPPPVEAPPPAAAPPPIVAPPVVGSSPAPEAAPSSNSTARSAADYLVGPQDMLAIAIWDWPDMSGKYRVEMDGTFSFPMLGRVPAAGMKLRDLEADLKRRLSDGYFKNPQISVTVEQYRSQRIFIVGEVRTPGNYPLTGGMTLIEALAHAGSLTADASPNAIVVRPAVAQRADGAEVAPDSAEVLQVDLKKLEGGSMAENIALRDGDTIFVARAERPRVFVFGQVRSPGAYQIETGTTLLQVLSLAGGVTDRGSTRGIKIVRWVNGKKVELKAKLDDLVQSGDTIVVSERFF